MLNFLLLQSLMCFATTAAHKHLIHKILNSVKFTLSSLPPNDVLKTLARLLDVEFVTVSLVLSFTSLSN